MATAINLPFEKERQNESNKELKKKFDTPGREPDKALDGMYGLWQNSTVTIQDIREKNRRKKWLL